MQSRGHVCWTHSYYAMYRPKSQVNKIKQSPWLYTKSVRLYKWGRMFFPKNTGICYMSKVLINQVTYKNEKCYKIEYKGDYCYICEKDSIY